MDACDMADRSSGEMADGKMDNEECKNVFDPATMYDEMLAVCAGGDPATMQKCKEEGVGTAHCVEVMKGETGGEEATAKMVCHMHDIAEPPATATTGIYVVDSSKKIIVLKSLIYQSPCSCMCIRSFLFPSFIHSFLFRRHEER